MTNKIIKRERERKRRNWGREVKSENYEFEIMRINIHFKKKYGIECVLERIERSEIQSKKSVYVTLRENET